MPNEPRIDQRSIASPSEAAGLCDELQKTIGRLTGVLVQETALLKEQRAIDIQQIESEKTDLTRSFLRQFALFKENAAYIGAKAPVAASDLGRKLRELDGHIRENLNVLEAAQAVSRGVVQAIFNVAEKENAGPLRYGSDAALSRGPAHRATTISLDQFS